MCVIKKIEASCKRSTFSYPSSLSLFLFFFLPLVDISVGRKLGNGVRLGRAVGLRVGRILFIMFSYLCCRCCQWAPPAQRLRFLLLAITWEQAELRWKRGREGRGCWVPPDVANMPARPPSGHFARQNGRWNKRNTQAEAAEKLCILFVINKVDQREKESGGGGERQRAAKKTANYIRFDERKLLHAVAWCEGLQAGGAGRVCWVASWH